MIKLLKLNGSLSPADYKITDFFPLQKDFRHIRLKYMRSEYWCERVNKYDADFYDPEED